MSITMLAEVALFSPPYTTLTYTLPKYLPETTWCVGLRVAVPLGKSTRSGIILSITPSKEEKKFVIKALLWPLEKQPILQPWYRELAEQIAIRQTVTSGHILANILPVGLRSTQTRLRFWNNGTPFEVKLPFLAKKTAEELLHLGNLWTNGCGSFCESDDNPKLSELCILLADAPWSVRPSAKAQVALLEYLLERGAVPRVTLIADLGKSSAVTLATLVKRGLVAIRPADDYDKQGDVVPQVFPPLMHHFTLTDTQQKVFNDLAQALESEQAKTHLLFGITGSGKTAVYLELAREVLSLGKSVLLLAPEVALALKLHHDVQHAFPDAPAHLFHGYLSSLTKNKIFRHVAANQSPMICIGTRSALFLPIENIGLIILDEEHDASFKQDEGLIYQAKEIAWYRAKQQKALLVIGSATPDLKSYHAAMEGKIPIHHLKERVGGGELPEVQLITLPKKSTENILAAESIAALQQTVAAGEQAIILLNRRGYAPLMYCLGCATVAKCPHCDIGLAYHKGRERLVCHYCGYTIPFPSPCSFCKNLHYLPMGEGTERLEEILPASLPAGTHILRLDRDSTRRPGQMEKILSAFAKKEASILVGTQMLSKGHHFPDVTLAIIADADLGLNLPDYRAAERTFQLIVQSSGRSGRGEKKGRVIIQTRDPSHYCWSYIHHADYEGFFQREIALRERRLYPPFINLALIRISYEMNTKDMTEEVNNLGALLREKGKEFGITVLGPAPAPLPFLKGRKRFHCLLKGESWQVLRTLFTHARRASAKGKLRITLDLDPVNML